MDPSTKNWIKVFAKKIHQNIDEKTVVLKKMFREYPEESDFIHFYFHSTGLFYGYALPINLCNFSSAKMWSNVDNYKIALTEGLFVVYLHNQKERFFETDNYTELFDEAFRKIYEFYVVYTIHDSYFRKKRRRLNRSKKDVSETLEDLIDFRVNNPSMLKKGFWKGSQFSVFSYLDILYFSRWLVGDYLFDNKRDIKKSILRTMISAVCMVYENPQQSFQKILKYFIASANISKDFEQELFDDIENKIGLNYIDYNQDYPIVIKKLIYEYALISLVVEELSEENEEAFLQVLRMKLGLSADESQYSLVVVDNFIANNKNNIVFFKEHTKSIDVIRQNFTRRFKTFYSKNSAKIVTEISESRELMELLWKSKNEKLTIEEKEKVKEQILDLLKTLPSLAIFMVPGGAILLPIILKILPEELFIPSSFRNK